jgi:hypothetical protein
LSACFAIGSGRWRTAFFATIFLGSGLMFLSVLFLVSTLVGGVLVAFEAKPEELIGSATFHFARAAVHTAINVYLVKMASVFMITSSTVFLYTGITPRSLAISGYALALLVLCGSYYIGGSLFVFPLWVGLVSIFVIIGIFASAARLRRDVADLLHCRKFIAPRGVCLGVPVRA